MEELKYMDPLPTTFNSIIPEPINFVDKAGQNCIVIIENKHISYFNYRNNTIRRKISFTSGFHATKYGHAINEKKNNLYVFGVNGRLAIINLHSHIDASDITYIDEKELMNCNFYAATFATDELHLINENTYCICDIKTDDKLNNVSKQDETCFGQVSKLLYNKKCTKLFAFGAGPQYDLMYYYESQCRKRWSCLISKTPYQMPNDYYHIVEFDSLFIFIYTRETVSGMVELYVFDVENMQLYNKTILNITGHKNKQQRFSLNTFSFIDNCNTLHLIDYKSGQHYQQNIFKLLPLNILNRYKTRNTHLVFGFVREAEDKLRLFCNMAIYLNRIIDAYAGLI